MQIMATVYRDIKELNIESRKMELSEKKVQIKSLASREEAQRYLNDLKGRSEEKGYPTRRYKNCVRVEKIKDAKYLKFYIA